LTEKQIKELKPSNLKMYGFRMEKEENILSYFLRLATKAEKEFQDTNIGDTKKLDNLIFKILSMTRSNNFHGLVAGNSGSALECLIEGKIYRAGVLSYAGFYKSKSAYVVGFALNGGKFLELRLTLNNNGGFVESFHYVDELSN
jgi:hypothetical protein